MARYRYRTAALAGPWRALRQAALDDAVAAKQARPDESAPEGVLWVVPGEIEEEQERRAGVHARVHR